MMGIFDKVKDLAAEHEEQVNEGIDKLAGIVEGKVPDQYDSKVADGADKLKGLLDKND